MKKITDINEYIAGFPDLIRQQLIQLRSTIKNAATGAKEVISYNMPAYKLKGVLVYFAGCKNHIGFYPGSSPIMEFKDDLKTYTTTKGAIHFPIDQRLPVKLITKIVKFRIKEMTIKHKLNEYH